VTTTIVTVDVPILKDPTPASEVHRTADPEAYALEVALRSLVPLAGATNPRDHQRAVGASEIGHPCPRRIAYRLAGATPAHLQDPMRRMSGTGLHLALAEGFRRLDAGAGRFLVEHPVRYRGVPGTVDLYDRLTHTIVDWKSTVRSKLARVRNDGPRAEYAVQAHTYGAGLLAQGEDVRHVALAFIAVDGTLDDLYVVRYPLDVARADQAIDRLNTIAHTELTEVLGVTPSTVEARPGLHCKWCDYHNPSTTDLDVACDPNR